MNRALSRITFALFLTALTPVRAGATVFSYHLDGQVARIVDTQGGGLQAALAPQGVKKDAAVSIDWTVDSGIGTHSPPGNGGETYFGVITSFTIQIGTFSATGADTTSPLNKVVLLDHATGVELDTMDIFRSGTDTGQILEGSDPSGLQLILHLFDPSGDSSTSLDLGDQTPSHYPSRMGTIFGVNGEIDFTRPLSQPPVDTTAKCRAAQLAAGGALCKATLSCLAAHAKAPDKDPGEVKLTSCRIKADGKFVATWDKAAAAAANKGLTCRSADSGATAVSHVDAAVDDLVALAGTIDPPQPALVSAWLAAAGGMCSAALKAESKNVSKPDPAKIGQLRDTARTKLMTAAQKAVTKAKKAGVIFDPEPDISAWVASVDALIDEIVAEVNGP